MGTRVDSPPPTSIVLVNTAPYFSPDFATAQRRFRVAVAARNGRLDVMKLAARGPQGEELTIDIGWFGAPDPHRIFVHSSGLHGIEGFVGSAIQLRCLDEALPRSPANSAIVMVHVLNPYGMAWLRRVNENNVDLNRNFWGANDGDTTDDAGEYLKLDSFLNPQSPPRLDLFYLQAIWLMLEHGMPVLRQAIAGGQFVRPKGLFYGGNEMEEGPRLFQQYVEKHFPDAKRIVAIDVHTGLGSHADYRLLVDAKERKQINKTMRETFGERVQLLGSQGIAYRVQGALSEMYYRLFPKSEVYFAGQEFGTFHPLRVLAVLRAENRWHHYGAGIVEHPCKRRLMEVFCPDDKKWRMAVLHRGREVFIRASALAFEQEEIR